MIVIVLWLISVGMGLTAVLFKKRYNSIKEILKRNSLIIAGVATVIKLVTELGLDETKITATSIIVLAFGFYCEIIGGL